MSFLSSNKDKYYLGVDIGSTSIKVVELIKDAQSPVLKTYGFSENITFDADWQKSPEKIAKVLTKVLEESGVSSKNAISALPTFSVFSSVLNLNNISRKDIDSIIQLEAKKLIPLPIEELIIDWKEIKEDNQSPKDIKVLLTGAPKKLVQKYIDIFKYAKINLLSLETESFSLIRSIVGTDQSVFLLVEIGANTTDISVINNKIPILNRSIDVGGLTITKAIKNSLNVGLERAEQFKYDLGISLLKEDSNDTILKIIRETISPIISEIKYVKNMFENKDEMKIEKIILSGGSSMLAEFGDYLSKILDIKVIVGDPWHRIIYNDELKPLLNQIGPFMSVAIGLALRDIE